MAFIKRCVSTIMKCITCGKPALLKQQDDWFCQDCVPVENLEKALKEVHDES